MKTCFQISRDFSRIFILLEMVLHSIQFCQEEGKVKIDTVTVHIYSMTGSCFYIDKLPELITITYYLLAYTSLCPLKV